MSSPSQTPALDLAQFDGFTPGPWWPSFDDRLVESDEGVICEVYPQDLAGDDGEVSEEESRACEANNAALIAAAPALLAECRRLREREQVLAEALARILRIHNRPKGWNRIEHARSIEAWEADARAALDAWAAHRADLDTFAQEDR